MLIIGHCISSLAAFIRPRLFPQRLQPSLFISISRECSPHLSQRIGLGFYVAPKHGAARAINTSEWKSGRAGKQRTEAGRSQGTPPGEAFPGGSLQSGNYWFNDGKVPSQAPIAIGPTACTRMTPSSNEQNAFTPVVFWLSAEAS